MADDLDYIETLDDLANAIKVACQHLDGPDASSGASLVRASSFRSGLSLGDLGNLDDDNDEEDDKAGEKASKRILRQLLLAWQKLVETLFAQKKFLEYAPSLENCIAQLSDLEPVDMKRLRDLVHLMTDTVENHTRHECTEIRYVTLLEVVLSYNPDWTPSSSINEIWEELELRVEADCDAVDFRRVAYKVLVQLPWLKPSSGLLVACGYEESETISDADHLPDRLRSQFDQIYSTPSLRADKVHQVLESLPEDEAFTITITFNPEDGSFIDSNGQGLGKTTLAALIAAHPTISQNFDVLWVDLEREEEDDTNSSESSLTHRKYIQCLEDLCGQLDVTPNWPDQILRLEDPPVRVIRELEHMTRAKEGMTKLLEAVEQNVVIVVDGVHDENDYAWFLFLESQSTIVVSKANYIPGTTYTVEMEGFGESEAIELFANESSNDSDHSVFHTLEARTVLELCAYHPLIIRTAAHWFKMKQVTAGLSKGLEELLLELSVLRNNKTAKADIFKVLSEVMKLMLTPKNREGGVPSKVFKLCLASASVVFGFRKFPLDLVLALWSQLLTTHPDTSKEMGNNPTREEVSKQVWFIAEAFIHLGLFSFSEEEGTIVIRLHHQLYIKYGVSIVPEQQPPGASVEETKARWQGFLVTGYNARLRVIKESEGELQDVSRPYVLRHIIQHMIDSKAIPKVLDMLKDDRFCRERLSRFGWIAGARMHVDDCQLLADRAQKSKSATRAETQKVVLSCLKKISLLLNEEPELGDETRHEKAMALHLIGFAQAENNGINEALTSYKNAMQLMGNPSHHFNAVIMYSQAVLHLHRNDHDKALKKLKACAKFLKDHSSYENSQLEGLQAELAQLRGDALAGACDYVNAETCYEEALEKREHASRIETGTVLYRRARLHQTMGELESAISALTECINWKLDNSERTSRNLAQAYSAAGDIYFEFHEDEKAVRQYTSAFETLADLEATEDDVERHLLQGKIFLLSGKRDESKESFDLFRKKTKNTPRLLMDQSAYDLRMVGKMFIAQDDSVTARDFFEEGIDLTMDRPDSLERACILSELGDCLFHLQQPRDAIICLEEALKIRKNKLGDCEMVLDSQISLGKMYKNLELNRECLNASKEVMYLSEKLYRGDEKRAASALFGVAEAYEVLGEYNEAVSMFEECMVRLKSALGRDHPDLANVMQRLAILHENENNFEKAYENYVQALNVGKAHFEVEHPQLGHMFHRVGSISRKREDFDKAKDFLQDALTIFKSNEMARETCLVLMELGDVYRMMKDHDTAIMCYERCFTFVHDTEEDPLIMGSLYLAFGHARLSKKQLMEAQKCFESGTSIVKGFPGHFS